MSNSKTKIKPNFEIYASNYYENVFLWFNKVHGYGFLDDYNSCIVDSTLKLMANNVILTLVTKVAKYYADNTSADEKIRIVAITNTIGIIGAMEKTIKDDSTFASDGVFGKMVKDLSDDSLAIINDFETKNYENLSLFTKFYDLKYDNLTTYNGNLHFADDWIYNFVQHADTNSKNVAVSDWFTLGTEENHNLFRISLNTDFYYYEHYFLTNPTYNFVFGNPSSFDC